MTAGTDKPVYRLFDETKGDSRKWFYFADEKTVMVRMRPAECIVLQDAKLSNILDLDCFWSRARSSLQR
jgi:hypothetical protein